MYKEMSDEEIKKCVFDILCTFTDYCDKFGLHYYLCGGTLLGAIRHKDFIPWDDDVDLFLTRPDYKKLHKIIKDHPISEYYEFNSLEAGNSYFPYGRIVDTRTFINSKYMDMPGGLWVDVIPVDGVPSNLRKCNRLLMRKKRLKKLQELSRLIPGTGKNLIKTIVKMPIALIFRTIGPLRIGKMRKAGVEKYKFEDSEYVAAVVSSCGTGERMKKSEFLPQVDVEFHRHMFHASACWDKYLHSMYGDYMQLLPVEKQTGHGYTAYQIIEEQKL